MWNSILRLDLCHHYVCCTECEWATQLRLHKAMLQLYGTLKDKVLTLN